MSNTYVHVGKSQMLRCIFQSSFSHHVQIKVTIKSARDLANLDRDEGPRGNISDPYVEVICGEQKKRTKHRINTLNPSWEEDLSFDIPPASTVPNKIRVAVMDKDFGKQDDFIGQVPLVGLLW